MGKCRSGLKGWWEGLVEEALGIATAILERIIKPSISRLVTESQNVMNRVQTEREAEFILGLLCWGFIAAAVAARWSLLTEFLLGMSAGVGTIAAWAWMMRRRRQHRFNVAANVDLLRASMLADSSGYERVEWVNKLLRKAWPYVTSAMAYAGPSIRDYIEPYLEEYRLGIYRVIQEQHDVQRVERYVPVEEVITSLYVNEISLGDVIPTIEGLKIYKLKDGKVTFKVRIGWQSNSQITLGVGTENGIVPIILENLKLRATVRVIFRITESPPFVASIVATVPAEPQPTVDFALRVVEASTTVESKITKELRSFISNIILDTLLWPHRLVLYSSPVPKAPDSSQLQLGLHGQLSVEVINGHHLVNLYPYVIVYCRPKFKLRTTSIENTHDPFWNQVFTMNVEDKDSQSLVLRVMNENKGFDEFVGTAVYPLKDLVVDKDVELDLTVQPRKKKSRNTGVDEEKKPYGRLSVELRYHVYTDSEREAAMKAEASFEEALARPDEISSYTTAVDLIHPY